MWLVSLWLCSDSRSVHCLTHNYYLEMLPLTGFRPLIIITVSQYGQSQSGTGTRCSLRRA